MNVFCILVVICIINFSSALLVSSPFNRFSRSINQKSSSLVLNEALGKAELVEILKEKTGLMKKDVESVLGAFTDTVSKEVLVNGKEIRLRDFGTFKQKVSKARTGRNPRTSEAIQISGSTSVVFSVSSALKVKDGEEVKNSEPKKE
eukprot:CAMPEP_0119035882 /NCGR_PEP_ID=MMETSP1177-20130426/3147_1 /TAXON_ID=2985 /ORGANISM="Ochromonas sp, Strain CCMP1899" /LENGTH=146 /DNA_ID=CAMNT_0006994761 /DNA_START=61 /DNA_END=501 /DNA_ORIENTATION=-